MSMFPDIGNGSCIDNSRVLSRPISSATRSHFALDHEFLECYLVFGNECRYRNPVLMWEGGRLAVAFWVVKARDYIVKIYAIELYSFIDVE
jgi:hypothetical protein